ncbi:MAG: FkbM family methyltransferase [Hyphomicrobium sp.]
MARQIANFLGYELRELSRLDGLDTIPVSLRRYFAGHSVDLLVDCGAFVGNFARSCRKAGYLGEILSLELAAAQYAKLKASAAGDAKWDVRQVGAGASRQSVRLNIFPHGVFNSIHTADTTLFDLKSGHSEQIEIYRLDELLCSFADARNIFLKTDTQGNDLAVLQGLGTRLADVQTILVEMSVQQIYQNTPSHWQMLDFVRSEGFEPYTFSPVSRDPKGALIEYDALFRRAPVAGELNKFPG